MKFALPILTALIATISIINNSNAQTTLEVQGKIQLYSDTTSSAEPGMIRWNEQAFDFEGFMGNGWISLTAPPVSPLVIQIGCGPDASDTLIIDGTGILLGGMEKLLKEMINFSPPIALVSLA